MKKVSALITTLVGCLSIWLVTTAHADDDISAIDICTDFSLVAKMVMTARQQDRPMSETLPLAKNEIKSWSDKYGLEMGMDEVEVIAAETVMAAYKVVISTRSFKKVATTEFENNFFKVCYEKTTKD